MFHTTFDAEKKQWSGLKVDTIFNPKTSLGSVLLNVMQVNGSRVALVNLYGFLFFFSTKSHLGSDIIKQNHFRSVRIPTKSRHSKSCVK